MKHVKNFNVINESAPIEDVEMGFQDSPEFDEAKTKVGEIVADLEEQFYAWCSRNGHPDAEGDTDYDMSFDNILNNLISRY